MTTTKRKLRLTTADIAELKHVQHERGKPHHDFLPPYTGYVKDILRAHRLVRLGYLSRTQYSEQVRGEPRFYWWAFYLTSAGKRMLRLAARYEQLSGK